MEYLVEYRSLIESINDTILELTYDVLCEEANVNMNTKDTKSKVAIFFKKIINMLARAWKNMISFLKTLFKNAYSKLANIKNKKCYIKKYEDIKNEERYNFNENNEIIVDNSIITGLPVTLSTNINTVINELKKIANVKEISSDIHEAINNGEKAIDNATKFDEENQITLKPGMLFNANALKHNIDRYSNEAQRVYDKIDLFNSKINDIKKFKGELTSEHIELIKKVNDILNKYASYLKERSVTIDNFITDVTSSYDDKEIIDKKI